MNSFLTVTSSVSSGWWRCICRFRLPFWTVWYPHVKHVCGFSPVWVRICRRRQFSLKTLKQTGQVLLPRGISTLPCNMDDILFISNFHVSLFFLYYGMTREPSILVNLSVNLEILQVLFFFVAFDMAFLVWFVVAKSTRKRLFACMGQKVPTNRTGPLKSLLTKRTYMDPFLDLQGRLKLTHKITFFKGFACISNDGVCMWRFKLPF